MLSVRSSWLAAAFVVASCSSPADTGRVEDASEPSSTTQSTEPAPTSVAAVTSAATDDPETPAPPLPDVADPCESPASLPSGRSVFSLDVDGEQLPVGVDAASEAAWTDPIVVVSLHGAGLDWEAALESGEFLWRQLGPDSDRVLVFAPQADASQAPLWSKSPEFNPRFVDAFVDRLAEVVCLDASPVFLSGFGQGALAATQAFCSNGLDVELAGIVLLIGMVKIVGCEPDRAAPIISIDRYDYVPALGHHWDGRWDPPDQFQRELTGGIQATPDDLATWAEIYECADDPASTEIEDPNGLLTRPTTVLSHRDCRADLVAIGLAGPSTRAARIFDSTAADDLAEILEQEFARILEGPS